MQVADALQALISQVKLVGMTPMGGFFLCSGHELRVRYMDPCLESMFGDSVVSLHDLVPISTRVFHRRIMARICAEHAPLPDSLRRPMRSVPAVLASGKIVHVTLAIGRVAGCIEDDLFYVIVQAASDRPSRPYSIANVKQEAFTVATVLYVDIVDFSRQCARRNMVRLGEWMASIHGVVDGLLREHAVRKIETRGDCVICVTGTRREARDLSADQATRMMAFACDLGKRLSSMHDDDGPTRVRIGIATGAVVLLHLLHDGDPMHVKYAFGDTVNLAARMEQSGREGAVHLAESALVRYVEERGCQMPAMRVDPVKGMGMMRTALYCYHTGCWLEEESGRIGPEEGTSMSSGL